MNYPTLPEYKPKAPTLSSVLLSGIEAYEYDFIIMESGEECTFCLEQYAINIPNQCRAIRLRECGHIVGDICFRNWVERQPGRCLNWNHKLAQKRYTMSGPISKNTQEEFDFFADVDVSLTWDINDGEASYFTPIQRKFFPEAARKEVEYRLMLANNRLTVEGHRYLQWSISHIAPIFLTIRITGLLSVCTMMAHATRLGAFNLRYALEYLVQVFPILGHWCFVRTLSILPDTAVTNFFGMRGAWLQFLFFTWFWLLMAKYALTIIEAGRQYHRIGNQLLDIALERNYGGEGPPIPTPNPPSVSLPNANMYQGTPVREEPVELDFSDVLLEAWSRL
ncbi:hypothetical protein P280DRAFT_484817 [Massarina eburnea CBS 473.64]|uniref:RING-type domain-containing protein n=1 Tax=Massarina eburnea CBS 473.64 TaxID=1395130 RepID=A0A6A6RMB4_9PLEO|nr:hypothetical protein P280DRAFT_484817 [Massarina eburnea CBS 473.64]